MHKMPDAMTAILLPDYWQGVRNELDKAMLTLREMILQLSHQGVHQAIVVADDIESFEKQITDINAPAVSFVSALDELTCSDLLHQVYDTFDLDSALVITQPVCQVPTLNHLHHFHVEWGSGVTVVVNNEARDKVNLSLSLSAKNFIIPPSEDIEIGHSWSFSGMSYIDKKKLNSSVCDFISASSFHEINWSALGQIRALPSRVHQKNDDTLSREQVLKNTTVFLDRDGVINRRLPGDYVKYFDQFEFLPGVLDGLRRLSKRVHRIVIVTNQQGIGKQRMTADHILAVHDAMLDAMTGIDIDAVFFAPGLAQDDPDTRKPNVGMALQAKKYFPDIDWSYCYLVGDSTSDIAFGLRMGMRTVLVGNKSQTELADERFASLPDWIDSILH